jgi:hypothetical protein
MCRAIRVDENQIVSPSLVENFRRDGFVVVTNLLSEEELGKFGAAVDRAVRDRGRKDHRKLEEKSTYNSPSPSASISGKTTPTCCR